MHDNTICRFRLARECAAELVRRGGEGPILQFTQTLERELSKIINDAFAKKTGKHSTKREKMWSEFTDFEQASCFPCGMIWSGR